MVPDARVRLRPRRWVAADIADPAGVLLQAATEAITVPDPEFVWNPQERTGNGTVVNLDTWFWQDGDLPTEGSVTASAGPWSATTAARSGHPRPLRATAR